MPQDHPAIETAGKLTHDVPGQLVGSRIIKRIRIVKADVDHRRLAVGTRMRR
jgi:hypothetical protein